MTHTPRRSLASLTFALFLLLTPNISFAGERLCDTRYEDCRTPLVNLIRNENSGIDVGSWFMQDQTWADELIAKHQQGVPVRMLVDPRGEREHAGNQATLDKLKAAGIPMRYKLGSGNLHLKLMLFHGQNTVEFSAANYSPNYFVPNTPYVDYIDEVVYFGDDVSIVSSFRTKFDELWINTSKYGNYANITGPLTRRYAISPIVPELNFPPGQDYLDRLVSRINAETQKIDVIIYRMTDERVPNALVNAVNRGIPVRIITEPMQYRDGTNRAHAYHLDRLYALGQQTSRVQIKHRKHLDFNHQKSTILYSQRMAVFGSSNFSPASANYQQEHNYFSPQTKIWMFDWFVRQFEMKWNNKNTSGNPTGTVEFEPFVPLPPTTPKYSYPANSAVKIPLSVTLKWEGGHYAHKYDIYFGESSNPPRIAQDVVTGAPSKTSGTYLLPALQPNKTYYWKIVSKTLANKTATGSIWKFTTGP